MQLGDTVERALSIVGITTERVTELLGEDCRCAERREQLNRLDRWARRILSGHVARAREFLESTLGKSA